MKYHYHGAGPFPENEDYMDAAMRVMECDLRKAVSEEDFKELTIERKGWYHVSIDIEYQEWTGHIHESCFTGDVVANSMLDAYNKAKDSDSGIRALIPRRAELTRVARIEKTDIDFLGVKTDSGYIIEEELPVKARNHRVRIGQELMEARINLGYMVEDVARMAGIKPVTLANIEQGKFAANIDILSKIAECYGCELAVCDKE